MRGKYIVNVQISTRRMMALLDTGSDLCLIRYETYTRLGAPKWLNKQLPFRGVGREENKTMGCFKSEIISDEDENEVEIQVISEDLMSYDLLIGNDFF